MCWRGCSNSARKQAHMTIDYAKYAADARATRERKREATEPLLTGFLVDLS